MEITREMKRVLAELIINNIKSEFADKHLTQNLVNTLKIVETDEGIEVHIPAPKYSWKAWWQNKVIKPTYKGSYAQFLNSEGSIVWYYNSKGRKLKKIGNHIGFVEDVIHASINQWKHLYNVKIRTEWI